MGENGPVLWLGKRYHSLNYHLQQKYGQKVYKISLDGGFTCPNRDGYKGTGGCYFCSLRGSGDFITNQSAELQEQLVQGQKLIHHKAEDKYIAYFQAYSGTYAPIEKLRRIYSTALEQPGIVGLAIATRPDCLDSQVINLLQELNRQTNLWIELGLQTIHRSTAKMLNMHYYYEDFLSALAQLGRANIKTCAHIMLGLPGESTEDMLATARAVTRLPIWGLKIHSLYILKGTPLAQIYINKPFKILSMEEYIDLVVSILEATPPEVVIHRLTGDGPRQLLIGPIWSLDKHRVLNCIETELKIRDTWQGKLSQK